MSETLLSLNFLKARLSSEQQAELAVALGICLECGGKLCRMADGENVCTKCGLVWSSSENLAQNIPFPEEQREKDFEGHWQPPNALGFLKSLGDPALENSSRGGKALMRVLALSQRHDGPGHKGYANPHSY